MSWVDRPMGDPKRPYPSAAKLAAMPIEALIAHVKSESGIVARQQSDTAARHRALARAQRILKRRKKA